MSDTTTPSAPPANVAGDTTPLIASSAAGGAAPLNPILQMVVNGAISAGTQIINGILANQPLCDKIGVLLGSFAGTFAATLADQVSANVYNRIKGLLATKIENAVPLKELQDEMPDSGDVRLPAQS